MTDNHLSMFDLDAFELGALSPDALTRAEAHLGACARCRGDLEETRAAALTFRARVLPRQLASMADRLGRTGRIGQRWAPARASWRFMLGAAAGGALALVVLQLGGARKPGPRSIPTPVTAMTAPTPTPGDLATKGGPALRVFARRDGQVFAVADGARLRPGDELRFAVEPAGLPYLLLASVDGEGKVSVYYPFAGAASGPLGPALARELPDSIRLDAASGPERLFALFSRTPLTSSGVHRVLLGLGARGATAIREASGKALAELGADAQLTFLIEKDSR